MPDARSSLAEHRVYLRSIRLGDAATVSLDVDYLLAHCCERSRSWLLTHPDEALTARAYARLCACDNRFSAAYPLAYVLGNQPFMALDYDVTEDTLIPRADTGSLVEWVLETWDKESVLRVVDCGTGCGTIALMLAHERPKWSVTATDISAAALAVCERNAERMGVRIQCVQGSWFAPLSERYDLIVSNPPYLSEDDPHLPGLTHEPLCALVSEKQGMADLCHLISQAPMHLLPGGFLVLEHGVTQGAAVREQFALSEWQEPVTYPDLARRDRFTVGCWRGEKS